MGIKSLKTPLRYPGGKSRALGKILTRFPDFETITEFREPFIGGGSVSIEVTKNNPSVKIWVNDLYYPLYNFWIHLRDNSLNLYNSVKYLKNSHNTPEKARALFESSKVDINMEQTSDFDKSVLFYILNKCSFSGLTEGSSFSEQASKSNFSLNNIEKLPGFGEIIKDWKITNLDYSALLDSDPESFVYLDPPYEISTNLYGKKGDMHKSFDHDLFAKNMNKTSVRSLISYNVSDKVKNRFPNWTTSEFDHTYTMRSVGDYNEQQEDRKELLLKNY